MLIDYTVSYIRLSLLVTVCLQMPALIVLLAKSSALTCPQALTQSTLRSFQNTT